MLQGVYRSGEVYLIQHYAIKFVMTATNQRFSSLSSINKTDCYNIAEILLIVALNTKTLTSKGFVITHLDKNFYRVTSKLNLRPSNLQLMQWNFQIQYSYLLIEVAGELECMAGGLAVA